MGWLWATPTAKVQVDQVKQPPTDLTRSSTENSPISSTTAPSTSTPATTTPATPADQEDTSLENILHEFRASAAQTSTQSSAQAPPFSESPPSSPPSSPSSTRPWRPSILHPTSMDCFNAFDQAMFCQIVGGQFVNYYRYGSLKNCGELWSNFWFCARVNRGFMSDEEREKRVQAFYIARDARRQSEGSSEDVWTAREEADIRPFAERQFLWDLERFEKGQVVLRRDVLRERKRG